MLYQPPKFAALWLFRGRSEVPRFMASACKARWQTTRTGGMRRAVRFLPLIYADITHVMAAGFHGLTRGAIEEISLGLLADKMAHAVGMTEPGLMGIVDGYFVPVGCAALVSYVAWHVIAHFRREAIIKPKPVRVSSLNRRRV